MHRQHGLSGISSPSESLGDLTGSGLCFPLKVYRAEEKQYDFLEIKANRKASQREDNTDNQSVRLSMRQSGKDVDSKENQEPSQWLREERHLLAKTGIRYLELI